MINQYPLWKYLLIAVVLLAGVVYALPNLYGENPALQISATRGEQVNAAVSERVVEALRTAGIAHGEVELQNERLLVLLNFSRETAVFEAPAGLSTSGAELLIGNYAVDPAQDLRQFSLRPYEARVYKQWIKG